MSGEIIEKRYETAPDGRLIIDIAIDSVNDLYNEFDKKAVFRKRELDQDFVDYLIESIEEIKGRDYLVRISLERPMPALDKERIRTSIRNYFVYLRELERLQLRRTLRKTFLLFLFGVSLVGMSVFLPFESMAAPGRGWVRIVEEGVVIAAWVAMWEAFSGVIFDLHPVWQNMRLYEMISRSEVTLKGFD